MIAKVSVGTSATLIRAAEERKGYIVTNQGAAVVYLSLGGEATVTLPAGASPGMPLNPGERVIASQEDRRSVAVNQAIYGIVESGTCAVSIEVIP